jgi:hypothetical protein
MADRLEEGGRAMSAPKQDRSEVAMATGLPSPEADRFVADLHRLTRDQLGAVGAYCIQLMAAPRHTEIPVNQQSKDWIGVDGTRKREKILRSFFPLVCRVCSWTNVNLLNLGTPGDPHLVCHGCISRAYDERLVLLNAVVRKFEGETRFQTALRYIRETEHRATIEPQCAQEATR